MIFEKSLVIDLPKKERMYIDYYRKNELLSIRTIFTKIIS